MFVMWNFLLIPFSWIYRAVIVVRHKLFDSGLLKSRRFDIPVICIGNITVGGTKLSTQYYSKEIADVITALIIYLCAFSLLFKNKIRALLEGKAKRVSVGKGGDD